MIADSVAENAEHFTTSKLLFASVANSVLVLYIHRDFNSGNSRKFKIYLIKNPPENS